MLYGAILIGCLLLVLIGYAIGRRIGIKEGFQMGLVHSPFALRMDYYHTKQCPICFKREK